jgi:leucyl/phenylalanyl-tRNA--protein transferase
VPVEPPPSYWLFPDPRIAGDDDVVAVGADLAPSTLLHAYRVGMFPMHLAKGPLAWWSPRRRGVIPLNGLVVSRSLRRSLRRFTYTVDRDPAAVIDGCADPVRPDTWITPEFRAAYLELHRLGWVHSVEVWDPAGALAGGLYGVGIGGLFAGESMFNRVRDASKAALVHLVSVLREGGASLLDVQWATPHLRTLGAIEVDRDEYLELLRKALTLPGPWGVEPR